MNKVDKMKFNYFIENSSDEADALYELEQEGFKWGVGENPTALVISRLMGDGVFPYTISKGKDQTIYWYAEEKEDTEEMNKYSVTQAFMQDLKNWRDDRRIDAEDDMVFGWEDFQNEPGRVQEWRLNTGSAIEANNRLIAIIQWLNGNNVFGVDYKFYIAQLKNVGATGYLKVISENELKIVEDQLDATKFETFQEADEWTNEYLEVVEVHE